VGGGGQKKPRFSLSEGDCPSLDLERAGTFNWPAKEKLLGGKILEIGGNIPKVQETGWRLQSEKRGLGGPRGKV